MGAYDKLKALAGDAQLAARKTMQMSIEQMSKMRARLDSWSNAMTGLGTSRDKTTYTLPVPQPLMDPGTLEVVYHDDDIAQRIVSALPDECFREPFTVVSKSAAAQINDFLDAARKKGMSRDAAIIGARNIAQKSMSDTVQEQAKDLQSDLDRLGARQKMREGMTWGRLYGLGAILLAVDDGLPLWEPLDWSRVRNVRAMTVLDKRDLVPWRWYADVQAPKFGDIAVYLLQPVGVYVGMPYEVQNTAQVMLVHETRLMRFGGELTSKRLKLANQGSDYSILQKCFRALQLVNDNWQSSAALLADASQGVFKIKGLIDMISQQPDIMQDRFAFMDLVRSTFRAIVLDADGEDFERKATTFAGIPDMLEHSWTRASSAARMPKVVLMGSSTKGLGDTGDSEMRWWYDTVKATQTSAVQPEAERLLHGLATARGYDNPDDWSVVFVPLWQLTALEESTMHANQANADKIYLDAGVVTPEEMALSRFGGGKYSLETKIDTESRKRTMQLSLQALEHEAGNTLEEAKDPAPTPGAAHEEQTKLQQQKPALPPGNFKKGE